MESSFDMLGRVSFIFLLIVTPFLIKSVLASGSAFQAIGVQRDARARLYSDLESSPILQNKLVPLSQDSPIPLRVNLNIYKILEIVEPKQIISMAVFYEFEWKDEAFVWNPEDYANVSHIYMPYDRAWHPQPLVLNSAVENFDLYPNPEYLSVDNDGVFEITGGAVVHTHCHIDLTLFPFDHQTCRLNIGLIGQDAKIYPIAQKTELIAGVDEHVTIPAEWTVMKHSLEVSHLDNLPQVVYTVELNRASLYYLLCVVGPMAATSQLTLVVFWIPHASGERISFLMSIYVSSTLYLGFVGDTLPRKNYTITDAPRMIYFMLFNVAECILVLIATVLSMHLHTAEQKALHQMLVEETEAIRRRLKLQPKSQNNEVKSRRQQHLNLVDLDLDDDHHHQHKSKEDMDVSYLSKVCSDDTTKGNKNQFFGTKETETGKDNCVGMASRKRRFFEKVMRFLAEQKNSKKSCKICAQTVDKLLFIFFLSISSLFYCTIFYED